jgi:hypothetical protein
LEVIAVRRFLSMCLILGGAAAGGVFPGSLLAFLLVVGTGCSGSVAETMCFVANVVLGIGGAFLGSFFSWAIAGKAWSRSYTVLSVASGLAGGTAGYFWLSWMLLQVDPPL